MIVKVQKSQLARATDFARRSLLPHTRDITSNSFLLTASDGKLSVDANGALRTIAECGGDVEEQGSEALQGRVFADIVARLPETEVTLASQDNKLSITAGKVRISVPLCIKDDFPDVPVQKADFSGSLDASTLQSLMRPLLTSRSRGAGARAEFTGICFRMSLSGIRLASSEHGHRTTVAQMAWEDAIDAPKDELSVIMPSTTCEVLHGLLDGFKGTIGASINKRAMYFVVGDITIISPLINQEFPQAEVALEKLRIAAGDGISRVLVSRKALAESLRRTRTIMDEDPYVQITGNGGQPIVVSTQTENGFISEEVDATYNHNFSLGISGPMLVTGLDLLSPDIIALDAYPSPRQGVMLTDDERGFQHYISGMALRK